MTAFSSADAFHAALARAVVTSPQYGLAASFVEYATIKTKDRGVIRNPTLNPLQREVCEAVSWCLVNRKPIRLVILKPRQKGLSTISTWVLYWLMRVYGVEAVIIGGQSSEVKNLWKYFRRYVQGDLFDWGFECNLRALDATFGNGASCIHETARDEDAGRGGTFHLCLATEAARWREGGVADADAVLAGILACVPPLPETCVILESTAKGNTGFFYEYYQESITLAEAKAGKWAENGFIKIFSPWYAHDDSRLLHEEPKDQAFRAAIVDAIRSRDVSQLSDDGLEFLRKEAEAGQKLIASYRPEERAMAKEYRLTPDQIRWYRTAFKQICKSNISRMKREFPATDTEAFNASTNQFFSTSGLRIMRQQAVNQAGHRQSGTLEGANGRYSWVPTDEEHAYFSLWEAPQPHRNYLVAVDTARGEYTQSSDPDKHSALVIRQGWFDPDRGWIKHKVVARTVYECRWLTDILIEMVWRLSCFYGRALIIPESNLGQGLIKGLRDLNAPIYQRNTGDMHGDVRTPKPTGNYGFETTGSISKKGSRDWILENLAKHVREFNTEGMGVEFFCEDGVNELSHFIVPPNGRPEAAPGHHDDDVMALAIGMNFIESHATRYVPPVQNMPLPRDLQALMDEQDRAGRGQWS